MTPLKHKIPLPSECSPKQMNAHTASAESAYYIYKPLLCIT